MEFTRTRRVKLKKSKLEKVYDKKPLIEFIVALLSIPSLILLVILNFNSLRSINGATPTPTPISGTAIPTAKASSGINNTSFFSEPVSRAPRMTRTVIENKLPCNKNLGPVSITSPGEGTVVTANPVEVNISYDDTTYCSAVWSYSINGSSWSGYSNNSVALYNLPDGPVQFTLRVKSLTSPDTTTLTRDFTYNGQVTVAQPTNASGSAQ